jgi:hypothetical protein
MDFLLLGTCFPFGAPRVIQTMIFSSGGILRPLLLKLAIRTEISRYTNVSFLRPPPMGGGFLNPFCREG